MRSVSIYQVVWFTANYKVDKNPIMPSCNQQQKYYTYYSRVGTRLNRWQKMSQQVFQQIPAPFGPLIPKLCSAKSEIEGKWILMNPGSSLADYQLLEDCQPIRNQDSFPSKSDLAENSFRISEPNMARICWKTCWDILCHLSGLVTTRTLAIDFGQYCIRDILNHREKLT